MVKSRLLMMTMLIKKTMPKPYNTCPNSQASFVHKWIVTLAMNKVVMMLVVVTKMATMVVSTMMVEHVRGMKKTLTTWRTWSGPLDQKY
jgi:hypothetical protein